MQSELSFQQKNLFQQGFQTYSSAELKQIEWGLRFTPAACSLITAYALYMQDPVLLLVVAFLGMWAFFFPSGHPMDLIYNHVVRKAFGAVKLPPNPMQRRLACFAAGFMNTGAAIFFILEMPIAGLITGVSLLVLQAIVIFTHFCTLSWMYEGIMRLFGKWAVPIDEAKASELKAADAMVVDVRGPDEFSCKHLDNAINLPLEQVENHLDKLKEKPVMVYCRSGFRSHIAKQKLHKLGLSEVYDLGGYERAEAMLK